MSNGPVGVQSIRNAYPDIPIFLDLKFHDIPNTVAGALRAVTRLDVQYLNLHAGGGLEMMRAGLDAVHFEADRLGIAAPRLLAVTVLTSIDQASLSGVGVDADIENQVLRLARLTKNAGLAGVVCSAKEIEILRKDLGDDFILMVPGIRPQGSDNQDQKRVMSPVEAINLGASHLVIGRPITEAVDPQIAVADIMSSLA